MVRGKVINFGTEKEQFELYAWFEVLKDEKGMNWPTFMFQVKKWLVDYFPTKTAISRTNERLEAAARRKVAIELAELRENNAQLIAHNVDLQTKFTNSKEIIGKKNEKIAILEREIRELEQKRMDEV